MNSTELPVPSTLRAAGVICGLAAIAMLIGIPAGAAPADTPQLSIAVDNGRSATAAGDTLDSAITIRNLGSTEVIDLMVTQTMPVGLVFGSADADGVAGRDGVSWTVDLAPTAEAVVRSTMTVSDTPPELLRLATVVCAAVSGDAPPIVCASDSDQLPAGAAAEAAVAEEESAAASADQLRWYLTGGAVLVIAAIAVLLLMRRHRLLHLARTTTVVAVLAVVAVGTWSSTAPPVAATPAGAGPAVAVATMDIAALTAEVAAAAVPRRDLPVGSPVVDDPTGSAPTTTTPVPQPEPGTQLAAFTAAAPSDRAAIAVISAMRQIGLPYVWGGNGPRSGDAGFDCSGLTTFAYATAGVALPRTAHTQYYAGPHLAAGTALQPGDLVFYGTPSRVHHVGMFIGQGRMVSAPTFGKPVRTAYYRWAGDDFLGSTRPAATGQPTTGLLPYFAPPADDSTSPAPTAPPVFLAPPAPPLPEPVLPPTTAQLPETAALPEPALLTGTVLPVPTDPGTPAVTATTGALPVAPAPDVTVAPGPTTTGPTTTAPTTTAPTTTAPNTTALNTTAPTTTALTTGPTRPALVPPVVPAPVASTTAPAPPAGAAPRSSPTTAPENPAPS